MEDGPPVFPPGFTCPAVLWIRLADLCFRVRDCHSLWLAVPCHSANAPHSVTSSEPRQYFYRRFGLLRVRSPLLAESLLISFPAGTEMFHFPTYRFAHLFIQCAMTGHDSSRVAPFGYLRINARVQLPEAFRSLPRPSSPSDAKASFVCP